MKHQDLIDQLTLEEKAALLGGKGVWDTRPIPRLGIPSMIMSDGPNGLRRQAGAGDHLGLNESVPATCFPTAATMANSWDPELGEKVGEALGEEARALGVNILLGPGMNIKRNPLCGRNFEYFSEDPYLAGKMAAGYVRGIQSQGVYACLKHFAVNSQEERRMAMNAVVDERTLREIYLTGFEIALEESHPGAFMTSYNQVNGEYANENMHLLKEILRGEWKYDGFVVSDWGGSNDHAAAVRAGSDLEMPAPGLGSARELVEAVQSGSLSMEDLDARVDELLDAVLNTAGRTDGRTQSDERSGQKPSLQSDERSGQKSSLQSDERSGQKPPVGSDERSGQKPSVRSGGGFDQRAHHILARRAAENCMVLLKNEDRILPLKRGTKVAVVGDFAFTPRYQGAGSSMVNATRVESIVRCIRKKKGLSVVRECRGYQRNGGWDTLLAQEAIQAAREADVVLYFFGLDEMSESEGLDRKHMKIPHVQVRILEAMEKVNPNIVGILSAGSAVEMPWVRNMKALLHGSLTGQAGATAILNVLTGRVNPSGKLSETIPFRYEEEPSAPYYPAKERNSDYREGLYVGYRYFDTTRTAVRYPFGFGLSYTEFAYSGLEVTQEGVTFTLANTGARDGAEVAQLYVGKQDSGIFRAAKELKGFKKVFLKAGESQVVRIPFDHRTFRYWNRRRNGWAVEEGEYQVYVGGSSISLPLQGSICLTGNGQHMAERYPIGPVEPDLYDAEKITDYLTGHVEAVSDEAFSELLGYPVPDGSWGSVMTGNDALCQLKNAKNPVARLVAAELARRQKKADASGTPSLNIHFVNNMPLRAISKMSGGLVDRKMTDGIVDMTNGHFLKGAGALAGGFVRNALANRKMEKQLNR